MAELVRRLHIKQETRVRIPVGAMYFFTLADSSSLTFTIYIYIALPPKRFEFISLRII